MKIELNKKVKRMIGVGAILMGLMLVPATMYAGLGGDPGGSTSEQPPEDPGGGDADTPIDGGLSILLVAGVAGGVAKYRNNRKKAMFSK